MFFFDEISDKLFPIRWEIFNNKLSTMRWNGPNWFHIYTQYNRFYKHKYDFVFTVKPERYLKPNFKTKIKSTK